MSEKDPHRYDDMLDMPHPISKRHLPMSSLNRAAIFSPFAALTGFDDAIKETARLMEKKFEPDDISAIDDDRFQDMEDYGKIRSST